MILFVSLVGERCSGIYVYICSGVWDVGFFLLGGLFVFFIFRVWDIVRFIGV